MSYELNAILSLASGVGALIGWTRFNKTDPAFLPFILLLTAGFITEIISIAVMQAGYSNAIFYNLFSLTEAILITWQFRLWGLFHFKRRTYLYFKCTIAAGWLTETILRQDITAFNSYFIIVYSCYVVFMAINGLNKVLFRGASVLYNNPTFLICIGLVVYFTYTILVEIFWFYGLNRSTSFRLNILEIFTYVNLFSNTLFATATLWIPMKRQYILQS